MGDGMAKVIFVTGGSRSGKTSFALKEGAKTAVGGRKVYIATAQALDAEMAERIDKHKLERGSAWETVEEPIRLDRALQECGPASVVVIDCLTLWLSNLLCASLPVEEAQDALVAALADVRRAGHAFT